MAYESKTKIALDGKKLVLMRAKRRWTQKQAARRAKVSLPTYGNAERGQEVQAANAGRIAAAYNVEVEELEAKSA